MSEEKPISKVKEKNQSLVILVEESEFTNRSFIMEFWSHIFGFLECISIFHWVRYLKRNQKYNKYKFVEKWVFAHFIVSFIATFVAYYLVGKSLWVLNVIVAYGLFRVFEIIIYQINVLFFHPYIAQKKEEEYKIKSPTRIVVLLLHNYVEIMFWYAAIMIALVRLNGQPLDTTWGEYLRTNILCVATFDSSGIENYVGELYGRLSNIIFFQIITGIIMTLISIARFMSLLPSVDSIDKY